MPRTIVYAERQPETKGPDFEPLLRAFADLGGADTREGFWLLGGPDNESAIEAAAEKLRGMGYNVCNPAELETSGLAEGIRALCHLQCVGLIVLPVWLDSDDTLAEAFVADALNKPIYAYSDQPSLTLVNRTQAIEDHEREWINDIRAAVEAVEAERDPLPWEKPYTGTKIWSRKAKPGDPVPQWDEKSLD